MSVHITEQADGGCRADESVPVTPALETTQWSTSPGAGAGKWDRADVYARARTGINRLVFRQLMLWLTLQLEQFDNSLVALDEDVTSV